MTNVIPTAMTAQIETFCATLVRFPAVRNWVGERMPNAPKMTMSTPRIHTDCIDLTPLEEAVVLGRGLDRLGRLGDGAHAAPSFRSRAPVMAPTSCSTEVSAAL